MKKLFIILLLLVIVACKPEPELTLQDRLDNIVIPDEYNMTVFLNLQQGETGKRILYGYNVVKDVKILYGEYRIMSQGQTAYIYCNFPGKESNCSFFMDRLMNDTIFSAKFMTLKTIAEKIKESEGYQEFKLNNTDCYASLEHAVCFDGNLLTNYLYFQPPKEPELWNLEQYADYETITALKEKFKELPKI